MQATQEITRRKAAKASAAGQVISWNVEPGQKVQTGQELGTFEDAYGPVSITAPCSGVLGRVVAAGAKVAEGAPLCYVEPATSRQEAPQAARVKIPEAPPRPRGEAREANLSQPAPTQPKARRTTPALEVEELSIPPKPVKRTRPRRPKIVKLTCHPTDQQKARLDAMMDRLTLQGHDYSFSELQRCAFEWLLGLSDQDLLKVAEANRDREQAGYFGYGQRPPV
jgi:pyruvate/2-oxoglutarate dehydrogenase complex dihydrolipoamide acyltransferase (E2) component